VRLRVSLLVQARLRREGALRAALRAVLAHPTLQPCEHPQFVALGESGSSHFEPATRPTTMCSPVPDLKGASRRWRDGLRPPLTPDTGGQAGGYRVDGSSVAN
jgi:hypothetical protein